jgi:hypothetical protein
MKTKSLYMALAFLCLSCTKNPETDNADKDCDIKMECSLAPIPASEEIVKFVPPLIKDDEVAETSNTPGKRDKISKQKKIIKDGDISIEVEDVVRAKKSLDTTLAHYEAYFENEQFNDNPSTTSYRLKIRVPSKMFDALLKATENGGGKVRYKDINTRDVTEDYYDSEIRLESKRLFRTRYNELLTKTAKVPDILDIEENLRVIQEEIESQEGHLRYLNDQVLYSTLDVNLFFSKKTEEKVVELSLGEKLIQSLGHGWKSVIDGTLWIITKWPWIIILAVLILVLRRFVKRRKKIAA